MTKEEIESLLRDYRKWIKYFTSSLTYNPWDAYLEEKVAAIKKYKKKVRELELELESLPRGK